MSVTLSWMEMFSCSDFWLQNQNILLIQWNKICVAFPVFSRKLSIDQRTKQSQQVIDTTYIDQVRRSWREMCAAMRCSTVFTGSNIVLAVFRFLSERSSVDTTKLVKFLKKWKEERNSAVREKEVIGWHKCRNNPNTHHTVGHPICGHHYMYMRMVKIRSTNPAKSKMVNNFCQ